MYIVDPTKKSFIEVREDSHFPIQNLPYGVFRPDENEDPRIGVAIGDFVFDLSEIEYLGYFSDIDYEGPVFDQSSLNKFMALGREIWSAIREKIVTLLDENSSLKDDELREEVFYPVDEVILELPVEVSEFTDFYSSLPHATNVGTLIRGPENALMPNWKHLPVAYHGRGSSVILSEVDIYRPQGQTKPADADTPVFGPTKRLDFELEMGCFVGTGNSHGIPITVKEAPSHIFGMVIVNDWSARDVQVWEYKPLGPFLAKNFATSISPWVVTLDALEPFRTKGYDQDPEPLPYLRDNEDRAYDINLEVALQTETMEEAKIVTKSNMKYLYWNIAQQLTHHTITGCNMQTGDLFASGTISGPEWEERGCLLELTELGKKPVELSPTEKRVFLEDGDLVIMSGYAQGEGFRVGFGEVKTRILPAKELSF